MEEFMNSINLNNWTIQADTLKECENLVIILKFTTELMGCRFDAGDFFKEPCILFTEYKEDSCPRLIYANPNDPQDSLKLRLNTNITKLRFAQIIYQLSHELTHYVLRQYRETPCKGKIISWFEETVCEAMSLYILDLAEKHWEDFDLYANNKDYAKNIEDYLENELKKVGNNTLDSCSSIEELAEINNTAQGKREDRRNERNILYRLFKKYPSEIKNIGYYSLFIKDEVLIDFDKWKEHYSYCYLIDEIKEIHPKIVK